MELKSGGITPKARKMVSVLGRGWGKGGEAGVAIHPLVTIAQRAAGQCRGKYLVPIPSTWKSSDVSSRLHYILDQASGLSCITALYVLQVASAEALPTPLFCE